MASKFSLEGFQPNYQEVLKQKAMMLDLITDLSGNAGRGKDTVKIGSLAARTGQKRTIGSGSFTSADNNYGEQLLVITEELGDATSYDIAEQAQNLFDYVADFVNEAMDGIALKADIEVIAAMVDGTNGYAEVARETTLLKTILETKKAIEATGTQQEIVAVFSPDDYYLLVDSVQNFIRFDADQNGNVGRAGGVKILKGSTNVTQSLMFTKDSACYAWQNADGVILASEDTLARKVHMSVGKSFACKIVEKSKGKRIAVAV